MCVAAVTATLARELDVGLQCWLTVCLVSAALATARSYVWVGRQGLRVTLLRHGLHPPDKSRGI